ncbi:MAG: IPT/TIG domain-containing protein [Bacteroidota bacterium]
MRKFYPGPENSFIVIPEKKGLLSFIVFIFSTALSAQPTISSFSPASGTIGTTVTINGTNFSSTASNNIVFFGAVRASVSAATSTSLTVSAPAGATYQPLSVTVNNLTGYAASLSSSLFPEVHLSHNSPIKLKIHLHRK